MWTMLLAPLGCNEFALHDDPGHLAVDPGNVTSTSTSTLPNVPANPPGTSTTGTSSSPGTTLPSCAGGPGGPPVVRTLASADAKLLGEGEYDHAGSSVANAGDVDGDGIDDVVVGAFVHDGLDEASGAAYVVYGPVTGPLDLANADAKLVGTGWADYTGWSVASAGDLDADGYDDLVIGAPQSVWPAGEHRPGRAYVVYGPVQGTIDLSQADAVLIGEANADMAGDSVSGAGDLDGDGYDDLVIGARGNDAGGVDAGAVYVLYGPVWGTVQLADADAKLVGAPGDYAGDVAGPADVNGDGLGDVIVGGFGHDAGGDGRGIVYVVYGPVNGTVSLSNADAALVGASVGDNAGERVVGAGDVDGNGIDDLWIGAVRAGGSSQPGAAYLVYGPIAGMSSLANADATVRGDSMWLGYGLSGAGDVNADGCDDLLVSTPRYGTTFLLYGPLFGVLRPSDAALELRGEVSGDYAGESVAAGDFDGDGGIELLVGAGQDGEAASNAGAAYVVTP